MCKNYTINDDGSIDVDGYVDLDSKKLTKLPLKFRNISGDFYCYKEKLNLIRIGKHPVENVKGYNNI